MKKFATLALIAIFTMSFALSAQNNRRGGHGNQHGQTTHPNHRPDQVQPIPDRPGYVHPIPDRPDLIQPKPDVPQHPPLLPSKNGTVEDYVAYMAYHLGLTQYQIEQVTALLHKHKAQPQPRRTQTQIAKQRAQAARDAEIGKIIGPAKLKEWKNLRKWIESQWAAQQQSTPPPSTRPVPPASPR